MCCIFLWCLLNLVASLLGCGEYGHDALMDYLSPWQVWTKTWIQALTYENNVMYAIRQYSPKLVLWWILTVGVLGSLTAVLWRGAKLILQWTGCLCLFAILRGLHAMFKWCFLESLCIRVPDKCLRHIVNKDFQQVKFPMLYPNHHKFSINLSGH